jgi:O-antigen/teichoic acid export membrane protein
MYAAPASSKAQPGRSHMLDAAIAFAIRVGSAGLVFLLQVFLARMMDLGDYGSYVTAWTWLVMLGAFAPLGIAESAVRFLPRYRARGRHGSARAFFRFGLRTVLLASLLIAGIAVILAMAGDWLDNRVGLMILMIAAGLPFLATQNFLEGVARAHGWYRLTSVPIYLLRPLIIIGGCAAFYAAGAALDLPTVSLVVVAAMALVCIGLLVAVSRAMSREPQADSPDAITGSRRVWFKASVPLMLVSGVEDLLIYSDVLVLGILLDPDQVSIYFAAARALALANFVYYAFYFVSARGFSISNALADREKLQEAVWATTRATFWFTALAVAATLVAGPWLLAAFGKSFAAGYTSMWILGAGLTLRAVAGQSAELLITTGRQRDILIASVTALAFNVCLSFLLVPHYGIEGAAAATALAMGVRAIMLCLAVRNSLNLSVISFGLPSLRFTAAG